MESRTINSVRNIIFGTANKIVTLLLPFITRTMMLYLLGTSSLGVSTLFSSILSFLRLSELGVGSAIVYAMYKPIAENDIAEICALLKYFRKLYRIIGLVILVIGLLIMPFLPYLIKGEPPEGVNLYFLFFLYLLGSVVSYLFAGYRQSLLNAYQRSDIRHKISLVITICVRIGEIVVIYLSKNLYLYVLTAIVGSLCTNLLTAIVTRRMFPEIECKGEITKEEKHEIRKRLSGLFGTKLNTIVINQADTIIISAYMGLHILAQYGNYYYILSAVSGFIMIFFGSMTASIGNKIATDSKAEVYRLFKMLDFINNWIVGWCSICLLCLYQPFMIIWVKKELTLPLLMSILMTIYFYTSEIQRTIFAFKDAGGLWYEDRYRSYISMVFNVVSNIILVQFIGIYGIVVSTILSLFISIPWCNYVIFKKLFYQSHWRNLLKLLRNFLITAAIGTITYYLTLLIPVSLLGIAERLLICIIVPNIIYTIVFSRSEEFSNCIYFLRGFVRRIAKSR